MKAGDKVVCIDAEGWLDPDWPGPAPEKGGVYVIREALHFGAILAFSLVGFSEYGFYRACRFRPAVSTPPVETESEAVVPLVLVLFGKDGER